MSHEVYTKDKNKPVSKSAIEAICEERPDLKGKLAPANMFGSNSKILVAGDEIFKLPHSPFDAWRVGHEIEVLKRLNEKNLPVPSVTFESRDFIILGMTRAPGDPMSSHLVEELPADKYESLARSLGGFMAQMEAAFQPRSGHFGAEYDGENVDRTPYPVGVKQAFNRMAAHGLSSEEALFLNNLLHAYDEKYKNSKKDRLVMSHCDLHGDNVFFDANNPEKISAVIDFEISGFRPPEQGFREMWKKYPPRFVRFVLDEYSKQRGEEVPVADVAAALCNMFLVQGGYDIRRAVQELRAGFPELEPFANSSLQQKTSRKSSWGFVGKLLKF